MWSPNELLKIEKQRDILSYITLQFFHFKKVPLEHCPFSQGLFLCNRKLRSYYIKNIGYSLQRTISLETKVFFISMMRWFSEPLN